MESLRGGLSTYYQLQSGFVSPAPRVTDNVLTVILPRSC